MKHSNEARPPRVSVVIPTLNGGDRFGRALAALVEQDVAGGLELLVVDSGSRDGTPERARAAGARVLAIERAEFQHGRTRNYAIGQARGEIIALLVQDALPQGRNYLSALCAALERTGSDGAFARQVPRADCDPLLAERLAHWRGADRSERVECLARGDPVAAQAVFQGLAPKERYERCAFDNVASAVRRKSWERQSFPERAFGEDVAWARAILLSGGSIAFEPQAVVEHSHAISILREFRRIRSDHENLAELFGLRTVPSWRAASRGALAQWAQYRRILGRRDLSALRRAYWQLYAFPYALAETAAQLIGGTRGIRKSRPREVDAAC